MVEGGRSPLRVWTPGLMISFLFADSERVWRGGQDQLLTLLTGLLDRGHRVDLICHPKTLLEQRARAAGVRVYPVSFRKLAGASVFLQFLFVLKQVRPDMLAFNTPRPILLGNLASRLVPVRARIIFRRVNFPLRRNPVTRLKYSWGIDCIVAISESISLQLQAAGVPASRTRTIYEGIDLALYSPRRQPLLRRPGEPKIIGTVAHLSQEKGLSYLVEAAARIRDVRSRMRFVIVGEGRCRRALEDLVKAQALTQVFYFAGFQPSPSEYYGQFDVFVLPSLSEGLSSSILSAMAMALPVVATDVGGIPELVLDKENGLLVPPANPAALAGAIEFLASDPHTAFRMGQKGRQRVEEHFTLDRKILETEQLCAALLSKTAPVSGPAHG